MKRFLKPRASLAPGSMSLVLGVAGILLGPMAIPHAVASSPLADEIVREDPVPTELCANAHFVTSDERAHHLFRRAIEDRGGAFLGVGTDQNYLMAAWARPELIIMMDFDPVVVDIHRIYRAFMLRASTPQEFVALWQDKARTEARAALAEATGDEKLLRRLEQTLTRYAPNVRRRLTWMHRHHSKLGVPTFLGDAAQYEFLRQAFTEGRILLVRGDLTGDATLTDIGAVLTRRGVPMRVLYLSNAEKYFDYTPQFRGNMLGLPMDDQTVVLRTSGVPGDEWTGDGFYRYFVQSGPHFRAWLERTPPLKNVNPIRKKRTKGTEQGLYLLSDPPPPRSPR